MCACVCVCVCGVVCVCVCVRVCVCTCVRVRVRVTIIRTHLFAEVFSVFYHVLIFVWRYGNWRCIERSVKAACVPPNITHHQMVVANLQIAF